MFAFPSVQPHSWCGEYEWGEVASIVAQVLDNSADGMLTTEESEECEGIRPEKKNLDAAPAAKVGAERQMSSGAAQSSLESDAQHLSAAQVSQPGDGRGTGNTHGPFGWAVLYPNGKGVHSVHDYEDDAREEAASDQEVVAIYRTPALTDTEIEAITKIAYVMQSHSAVHLYLGQIALLQGIVARKRQHGEREAAGCRGLDAAARAAGG
jgi:hypothetical protein